MRLGERVGHTAAEDELVHLAEQVLYYTNLGGHLRAAHNCDEGALDVVQYVLHRLHLLLHEEAQHLVVLPEVVSNDCRRSVLAVSRPEGVHHVAVGVGGKGLSELLLPLLHLLLRVVVGGVGLVYAHGLALLLGVEAEVLQQQSLSRLQCCCLRGSLGAVGGERHGSAKSLSYSVLNLPEGHLGVHLAFRLAHVAHDDECSPLLEDVPKRWHRALDACVVGDVPVLVEGHVEVNPHDGPLALEVVVFDVHSR